MGLWFIDLRTREFTYYSDDKLSKAVNTPKGALFPTLYFAMGSLVWIGFLTQVAFTGDLLSKPKEIAIVTIIMFLIGIVCLRKFLWLIRGREELIIEGNTLTINRHGSYRMKPKIYLLDKITDIRSKQEDWDRKKIHPLVAENMQRITDFRNMFFRLNLGAIRFRHKNEQVRLFSNLTDEEAKFIIEEMKKRMAGI